MIKSVWCIQKIDNLEIKINYKSDEIIAEFFQSLLSRYEIDNDMVSDCIHLLYYIYHKKYLS